MKLVLIESPYAGNPEQIAVNILYAKALVRDALDHGEAPYASHIFFTQDGLLLDHVPEQRKLGIEAGLAWGDKADLTVVGVDRGVSSGMIYGIQRAVAARRPVQFRTLKEWRCGNVFDAVASYDEIMRQIPELDGPLLVIRTA